MDYSFSNFLNQYQANLATRYSIWILGRLWRKFHWGWVALVLVWAVRRVIARGRDTLVAR